MSPSTNLTVPITIVPILILPSGSLFLKFNQFQPLGSIPSHFSQVGAASRCLLDQCCNALYFPNQTYGTVVPEWYSRPAYADEDEEKFHVSRNRILNESCYTCKYTIRGGLNYQAFSAYFRF